MLVLSRRIDERILIGDDVRITVVSIRGNKVRIGIEAPDQVNVYREELIGQAKTGEPVGRAICCCLSGSTMTVPVPGT